MGRYGPLLPSVICADAVLTLQDHGLIVNAVASYVSAEKPRQAMQL